MDSLSLAERSELLRIARASLEMVVRGRPVRVAEPEAEFERLLRPKGAFVTLRREGMLRGCIGYVEPVKPLYQAVCELAEAAALRDYRFHPVQPEELPKITIEITVLSPLERVDDPSQIEVGRDGILIRAGPYQGLLLPQVAVEEGWDRKTFLEHTCLKAGLPPNAWQHGAEIYRFTGEVFSEPAEAESE
jgi:AmmeMemoRadiSam system protein A